MPSLKDNILFGIGFRCKNVSLKKSLFSAGESLPQLLRIMFGGSFRLLHRPHQQAVQVGTIHHPAIPLHPAPGALDQAKTVGHFQTAHDGPGRAARPGSNAFMTGEETMRPSKRRQGLQDQMGLSGDCPALGEGPQLGGKRLRQSRALSKIWARLPLLLRSRLESRLGYAYNTASDA